MKPALLITNLGTPESPTAKDVGPYLKEFLSDKYVLTMPAPIRWALVNLLIVPRRSQASAKNYQKIWTDRGSPLMFHTQDFVDGVRKSFDGAEVFLSMRYGKPSLFETMKSIVDSGHRDLWLFPLYPQYAESTVRTTIERVQELINENNWPLKLRFLDRFYDSEYYIDSMVQLIRSHLESFKADHLLFSYHGVPVSHVLKTDPTGKHCDRVPECCAKPVEANKNCYRFHCIQTTRNILNHLDLPKEQVTNVFQSRLGPNRWLEPATDKTIIELAQSGVKKLAVVCPAFVMDCLETLEEIGQEGRELFLENGGEDYHMIPCLNSESHWVQNSIKLVQSEFN